MTAATTLEAPSAGTGIAGTRQANARFDEPTRAALEVVAAVTDRTLTQLVRYAVTWWITQPAEIRWASETKLKLSPVGLGRPVNVRLPVHLLVHLDQLNQHAPTGRSNSTDRSNTIRTAVRAWLRTEAVLSLTAPHSENASTHSEAPL
ncbi:MAG: hypothetical protein ACOH1Y_11530 [Propionicimonas sp.]